MTRINVSTFAVATMLAAPVFAQSEQPTQTPAPATAPAAQDPTLAVGDRQTSGEGAPAGGASTAAAPEGLQEIVVTAQRRSENLQRAALAITAVSGDAITRANVSDPVNLTKLVPALSAVSGGTTTQFYLRGVGSFSANSYAENAIAFNVDGVYLERVTAPVGNFYDLERIEVLKGPQGTLYGRNATGGAINLITNKPRLGETSARIGAQYGNYDGKKLDGSINAALGSTVALRVSGQVVDRDGYLSDGYSDEVGQAGRVQLLWQPSPDWKLLLSSDYFHQGGMGPGSVIYPYLHSDNKWFGSSEAEAVNYLRTQPPAYPPALNSLLKVAPSGDGFIDSTFYGGSATIEGDMGFATLTNQMAYRHSRSNQLNYAPGFLARVRETAKQISDELRITSKTAQPLRYVAGVYVFTSNAIADQTFNQGFQLTNFKPKLTNDSFAVFGQLTYDITATLRATGGARYTTEQRTQNAPLLQNTFVFTLPTGPGFITNLGRALAKRSDKKATWKAGLEYDVAPQSLLYASVATGFKGGGFAPSAVSNTFAPERLTAYTIGSKNRFFDNRLQLNLEGFYWRYRDQQFSYLGPIQVAPNVFSQAFITANVGNARMYGVEGEAQYLLTPDDLLSADLQYLNARYTDFVYTTISAQGTAPNTGCVATPGAIVGAPTRLFSVDCSGRPGINSPKWTSNVAYQHTFQLGGGARLIAGANARLESKRYLTADFRPDQIQKNDQILDASLSYNAPGDRFVITGFVNNITNEAVRASAFVRTFTNIVYSTLRPPRTYGVRADMRF